MQNKVSIITVSGFPNSGKSTLAESLALLLRYKRHYTGGIFRDMAKERHMTIEEFYPTVTPEIEREVDHIQERLMHTERRIIVEGRISPFLAPKIPKLTVFLTVDGRISAEREKLRTRKFARYSLARVEEIVRNRVAAEREHYRNLYGIKDHMDPSLFDIVIDTSDISRHEVTIKVLKMLMGRIE